jgi:SAM-dependent methyltransferase
LSGTIVDIGCADRRTSNFLPQGCDYIGIDYPGTATGLYGTRPDVFADARHLPLRDASIDGIVLKDVLEHIDGPRAALRECARILRPGGTMVLWMPFMYPVHDAPYDYQRFTEHGLEASLGEAGFDVAASSRVLKPIVTAGLLASLALADSCERIMARQRWLLPLVPALVLLIALVNVLAFALGALPASGFMPAFNRVVAVRRG